MYVFALCDRRRRLSRAQVSSTVATDAEDTAEPHKTSEESSEAPISKEVASDEVAANEDTVAPASDDAQEAPEATKTEPEDVTASVAEKVGRAIVYMLSVHYSTHIAVLGG